MHFLSDHGKGIRLISHFVTYLQSFRSAGEAKEELLLAIAAAVASAAVTSSRLALSKATSGHLVLHYPQVLASVCLDTYQVS